MTIANDKKRSCKHCGKPATMLVSRTSPFSPQYPLCAECGNDERICTYYAHEQFKSDVGRERFAKEQSALAQRELNLKADWREVDAVLQTAVKEN